MVFSSTIFLFLFLPLTLAAYLLAGRVARNYILLFASLAFYAWGENVYVLLMLGSIGLNYVFGLLIDRAQQRGQKGKTALTLGVIANLGLLAFFKYANFLVDNFNRVTALLGTAPVQLAKVHLPIGISFFTFQAMSYIIDVYRRDSQVQKNPVNIALYITLFPQLIAGPIVRYHDVARQIMQRTTTFDGFAGGAKRFILGLAKKVLVANIMGKTADYFFSLPPDQLPAAYAWLGAIAYTLQIYYDFSGYSDMAIGLGHMFGFHFLENFNYPYISRSIREFWRRWHISLSTWFKDYLYIPLGGSRGSQLRTYANLVTVFFLCGFWHGASWTFIAWGLYHGMFLALERMKPARLFLDRLPAPVRHFYVLVVVIVGWVLFRAENFTYALGYLKAMVTFSTPVFYNSQIFLLLNSEFYTALALAILGSGPVFPLLERFAARLANRKTSMPALAADTAATLCSFCFLGFIFLYSIASIMRGSYNPFLYFRF